MNSLTAVLALGSCLCLQSVSRVEPTTTAPNVVLIIADDMGYRDYGFMGHREIRTPRLDRLSRESLTFRRGYVTSSGLRTPILVRWPSRITPRKCEELASALDIAPTVLEAAGVGARSDLQGVDLLDEPAVTGRRAIFGEIFTHNSVDTHTPGSSLRYRWVVADDWKLIAPDRRNEPNAIVELFDVTHDPEETRNLAEQQPLRVADLMGRLEKWWGAEAK